MKRNLLPLIAASLLSCGRQSTPPYSPQESVRAMQIEEGYRVEPFLAEPDVIAPAAMEIDEDFRIWVVEDSGYPLNVEGKVGRIKLIEDTNGDGRPDKVTVFADNLVLPNGIMRWKKGVLVTHAPDLLYLEDTNGDGKADVRKPMLTGFAFTNPQHTVNSPVYGLDNWIYLAHENPTTAIVFKDRFGDRGSDIRFVEQPQTAIKERGRNIRFRPDAHALEALSGTSQFGQAFDEFGRHFTLNNTYHANHEVIAARYLRRNADMPVASATANISADGQPAKVFPIAAQQRFEMLTNVGEFTSACGATWWNGSMFVAEPAHNLVFRGLIEPSGATYKMMRAHAGKEFIASRDPWFRPVNFYAGPDGSLYMLDFYRLVIEHPEWMSSEDAQPKNLSAGGDRGRIYRISHGANEPRVLQDPPSRASVAQLVESLASSNAWWRRTAQRLLVDRRQIEAESHLTRLLESSSSPAGRVHALWTLDGLGKLTPALIAKALNDPVAGVRENAIRLAETRLESLTPALLNLKTDADPRVRFQLLCTLGFLTTPAARAARDHLLEKDIENRWMQIAALSASSDEAHRLFAFYSVRKPPAEFMRLMSAVIGARGRPEEVTSVLLRVKQAGAAAWSGPALEGLASGIAAPAAKSHEARSISLMLAGSSDAAVRRGAMRILEKIGLPQNAGVATALAAKTAEDTLAAPDTRGDALILLGLADAPRFRPLFERLIDPREAEPVQVAAIAALGRLPGPEAGKLLIARWRSMTPAVRQQASDALFRDPGRLNLVMDALRTEAIQPWTLGFRQKRQLIMHRDDKIRTEARSLLEKGAGERQQIIERYRAALAKAADAGRGHTVFRDICSKCHKLNAEGAEVGPNLATVRHQPKQVLLADILDPNRAISQGFESYVIETASGQSLDGVLGPQTPSNLTLRREEGKEEIVARKDIKSIHVTNLSAMPADLEKQVDPQQMADLLEYIKTSR